MSAVSVQQEDYTEAGSATHAPNAPLVSKFTLLRLVRAVMIEPMKTRRLHLGQPRRLPALGVIELKHARF